MPPWEKYAQPQASTPPAMPQTIPLPESPSQIADRERNDAAAYRDQTRTDIQVRDEGRKIENTAFDHARALRDDFNKSQVVKDYATVVRQYSSALKTQPTPSGDQALITAYAKMLDPGSVVREQEFSTVANADSALGQIKARLEKELGVDGAGMLRPEIRARVRDEMLNLTKGYNQAYNQLREQYSGLATRSGINPEDVVGIHAGRPFHDDILKRLTTLRESGQQQPAQRNGGPGPSVTEEAGLYDPNVSVSDEGPTPPTLGGGAYDDSLVSQAMSGAYGGIASTLGAPVDLMTMGLNLVPQGLNAIANTDVPMIEDPVLGGEWWRGVMGDIGAIRRETTDPSGQFVRRVGESVGASLIPMGATARTGNQVAAALASGLGGGIGAATAQQVAPGNPYAELAGEVIGGGGAGLGALARGRQLAQREIEAAVPTVPQLKEQAGDLYRAAEASGATADPTLTQQLADDLRGVLRAEGRVSPTGRISEVYPKAREAMQLVDDYAGQPMSPTQMQTVRSVIADGMMSTDASERRIARLLMEGFDDWADPLAPQLAEARGVASRYLTTETLERARELAGARAGQFSGSGFENALRTEYRALDRNAIKGRDRFSDEVLGAVENVSRGTPASNIARGLGRFAPTGVVSTGATFGVPFAVGSAVGGPGLGTALGLGASGVGAAGRAAATRMGIRNADIAELIARNGGAINQAPLVDDDTQRVIAAILAGQSSNYLNE